MTPNNYVPVALTNITDTTTAFAYFEPIPRKYTLTFYEGNVEINHFSVSYGTSIGKAFPLDLFKGEYIVKMYRDQNLTKEYSTNHTIIGDTNVFISKIVGSYDAERDSSNNVVGDTIFVKYDENLAKKVFVYNNGIILCDISQYPNNTICTIEKDSIETLIKVIGEDIEGTIIVPRGSITLKLSDFKEIIGDGKEISFSVGNGPANVKISSALKKLNYTSFLRFNLKSDNISIMDLNSYGIVAKVSLFLDIEGNEAKVWNIKSSGATTEINSTYSNPYVSFETDLIQFYAIGSGTTAIKDPIISPYGEIDVDIISQGIDGSSTLNEMKLDNKGNVVFVPSTHKGTTITRIGPGALNSIVNSNHIVIPYSIEYFSWNSWSNSIQHIYFTGNCPIFDGTKPSTVTVHYSSSMSGWDSSIGNDDLKYHSYYGSYKKDTFTFLFYVVDEEIVIHRYIHGQYFAIPESISVDGTEYPVSYIGDSAFMYFDDSEHKSKFGLRYNTYSLNVVELSPSIKGILSRAFFNSSVKTVSNFDMLAHIWDEAFYECSNLSNIKLSNELIFIGYSAFENCNCNVFTRVSIPDSVIMIRERAYYGCSNLTNISIGKGLETIPENCFAECVRLTELNIPENVIFIDKYAFYNCCGLSYVDLNQVSEVGDYSFYNNSETSAMEFIVLGKNIKKLGISSFGNNKKLSEIEVHCEYFEGFENAFENVNLQEIKFFASDEIIGSWSKYNTTYLNEPELKKDNRILHIVEICLILFFIVIGIVSYKMRLKLS